MSIPRVTLVAIPGAKDVIVASTLTYLVEAAAITIADSIKRVINTSTPAGKRRRIPGVSTRNGSKVTARRKGWYTASAPGQAPAERENIYAPGWKSSPAIRTGNQVVAFAYNDERVGKQNIPLGAILEEPTNPARKRPHIEPGIALAGPQIAAMANAL